MTAHIESKENDIAKKVLLPGDPLRAKYIAEKFLENAVCINQVRGMLGYTGTYRGEKITVFSTGMGMPSMGIYAYELCQFYGVEELIRIGTCGTPKEYIDLKDIILATESYTHSSFPYLFFEDQEKLYEADETLNHKIEESAFKNGTKMHKGRIGTSDIFDPYVNQESFLKKFPNSEEILAFEMEAAALFAIGKHLHKKTSCLLTVVDVPKKNAHASSEERELALNEMIQVALDALVL